MAGSSSASGPVGPLRHTACMRELGNALTVFGILVTLVAYFQDSRVSLAELEPGLTARWKRSRAWARRKLGRGQTITITANSTSAIASGGSATISMWSPIRDGDDDTVKIEKLQRNLDRLRAELNESRAACVVEARELEQRLMARVQDVDERANQRHMENRQATTAAMRWEVRGLLVTLVGAGLSILA